MQTGQPQNAGVQLPHGRPRDAAHHDAAQELIWWMCSWPPPNPARTASSTTVELQWDQAHRAGRGAGRARLPVKQPRKGDAITNVPADTEDATVFHAGTTLQGDALLTSGGRVMCVTMLGDSVLPSPAACLRSGAGGAV